MNLRGSVPLLTALGGALVGWGASQAEARELRRDVDAVTAQVAELRGVVTTVAELGARLGAIEYRLGRIESQLDRMVR